MTGSITTFGFHCLAVDRPHLMRRIGEHLLRSLHLFPPWLRVYANSKDNPSLHNKDAKSDFKIIPSRTFENMDHAVSSPVQRFYSPVGNVDDTWCSEE